MPICRVTIEAGCRLSDLPMCLRRRLPLPVSQLCSWRLAVFTLQACLEYQLTLTSTRILSTGLNDVMSLCTFEGADPWRESSMSVHLE